MKSLQRAMLVTGVFVLAVSAHAGDNDDIFRAARLGDFTHVTTLLQADSSLAQTQTSAGETALQYAVAGGHTDIVELLLAYGANVSAADDQGETALHWAATRADTKLVAALLSAGANVHATNAAGETPLHFAARFVRDAVAAELLNAGAAVNAQDALGQTPLHLAGRNARGHDEAAHAAIEALAAQLMQAGADPKLTDESGAVAWPHAEEPPPTGREPSGYPSYDDVAAELLSYQTQYPGLCIRHNLGASTLPGKPIWALQISDNVGVEEDEPEHKYIATMHGDEVTGTVMCLNLIDLLLTNHNVPGQERLTNIVDEIDIWIVPCMNPWGYTNNARANANGIDLNRAFPEGSPPNPEPNTTAGRQPEVATIMDWSFAHSFTLAANFHGGALVVNYPFDNRGNASQYTPDEDLFVYISEEYSKTNLPMWNGAWFHGITNGYDWYSIDGGMQDWSYRYMGCNEVTLEIGNTKSPPYAQMPSYWSDNQESMLAYMETCLIGVRGLVYDSQTSAPLAATVAVIGRDHPVYTDPDVGDYHRMLLPGTYDLRFEAAGYDPVEIMGVVVNSGPATVLNVPMGPPAAVTYPNGGETLNVDESIDITWVGNPSTEFHVQYTSNYGEGTTLSDDFETGALDPAYTFSGSLDWTVTTADTHGGTYAARAGAIGNSQITRMLRTVDGDAELSFWYRVSSEFNYDWFNFYIDNQQKIHVSGLGDWTQYTTTLGPGSHELKWEYVKDTSWLDGDDTVYVDDLVVSNDLTAWVDIANPTAVGASSTSWTPTVASTDCKVRVRAHYGGGSYSDWDESDAPFTVVAGPIYDPGDMNCDGSVDFGDINPFVTALVDPAQYPVLYPDCDIMLADVDGSGNVGFGDINPFVSLLVGG